MSTVFISYAREDEAVARTIAGALERAGFPVWWDRQVPPGKTWDEVIGRALDTAGCVLVLWSGTSVQSRWVREEAERAASRNRLIPVLIGKVEPPFGFGRIQAADLSRWSGDERDPEFAGLVRAISGMAGVAHDRPSPAPRQRRSRLLWIAVSLIAATVIAHVAWRFSGAQPTRPEPAIRKPGPVRPIPVPAETLRRPVTIGRSHEGCVPFADPEDVIAKGPVTAVAVYHAGYVHAIRLRYGTGGDGGTHGQTGDVRGGRWLPWRVPAGERITRVEGEIAPATADRSIGYVSRLRFFTDKGKSSPLFGSLRGEPFAAAAPVEWGLRTISGQANLTRSRRFNRAIASMTFHFAP